MFSPTIILVLIALLAALTGWGGLSLSSLLGLLTRQG
jgi:hypothetical protein